MSTSIDGCPPKPLGMRREYMGMTAALEILLVIEPHMIRALASNENQRQGRDPGLKSVEGLTVGELSPGLHPADITSDRAIIAGYPNDTTGLRDPALRARRPRRLFSHDRAKSKTKYLESHIEDAEPKPANEADQYRPAGGYPKLHLAAKRSRSLGDQYHTEDEEQDPSLKYSRKPRHKTRSDKYDYKGEEEELKRKSKRVKGKAQHRSSRKKCGVTLNDEYRAPNVEPERLTLTNNGLGMFARGKSSAPMARRDLPDLTFSEMNFLHKKRELDDARFQALQDGSKSKKAVKGSAQDVSHYFADAEPASLRRTRPDSVYHSHRFQSHDIPSSPSQRRQRAKADASKATLEPSKAKSWPKNHAENHERSSSRLEGLQRHHSHPKADGSYVSWSKSPVRVLDPDEHLRSRKAYAHVPPLSAQMHRDVGTETVVYPQSSISNCKPQHAHQGAARAAERPVTDLLGSNAVPQKTLYCLEDLQRLAEVLETEKSIKPEKQDSHGQSQGDRQFLQPPTNEEADRSDTNCLGRLHLRGNGQSQGRGPHDDHQGNDSLRHHFSLPLKAHRSRYDLPARIQYSPGVRDMYMDVYPKANHPQAGLLEHDGTSFGSDPDPAIMKQVKIHHAHHEAPLATRDIFHESRLPTFNVHPGSSHAKCDFIDLAPSSPSRFEAHERTQDAGPRLHARDSMLDDFDTALLLSDECYQAEVEQAEQELDMVDQSGQKRGRDQMIQPSSRGWYDLQHRWITDDGIEVKLGEEGVSRPQLLRPSAESASELKPGIGGLRP